MDITMDNLFEVYGNIPFHRKVVSPIEVDIEILRQLMDERKEPSPTNIPYWPAPANPWDTTGLPPNTHWTYNSTGTQIANPDNDNSNQDIVQWITETVRLHEENNMKHIVATISIPGMHQILCHDNDKIDYENVLTEVKIEVPTSQFSTLFSSNDTCRVGNITWT